ncbi:lactadherin-like isoform X2 [Tubulanus polymorphus]
MFSSRRHVLPISLLLTALSIAKGCEKNGPLGMISGDIQDWQISASSAYPEAWDKGCNEKNARLYLSNGKAWCAKTKSSSEWLQVDLGVNTKVTGVLTQGRGDAKEWVTSFKVSYSMNAYHWTYVADLYGNQRVFEGNADSYSVKHSYLDTPIQARYIKFHTVSWHRHPSMRVEVLGCQKCKDFIGMPPYGKISASSNRIHKHGSSCTPEDGHILSNKAWCAKQQNDKQWLLFDVGPPTLITGLVVKGRGDTKKSSWVRRFMLSYSNDSRVWTFYKDEQHQPNKNYWYWNPSKSKDNNSSLFLAIPDQSTPNGMVFGGNNDKDTARHHYLNAPFIARFIRFHPVEWQDQIAMRAGLIGCPYNGECGEGFMKINPDTPCIENMAFKKRSWIQTQPSLSKRHLRKGDWLNGQAARAVDGKLDNNLHSCAILDNSKISKPVWMVDLGTKTKVSGVIIYTWQGNSAEQLQTRRYTHRLQQQQQPDTRGIKDPEYRYRDYTYNLDRLTVYVDTKKKRPNIHIPENKCGFVTRLNHALFRPRLHLECVRPLKGRYVFIEAVGVAKKWNTIFSAVLCEVMVYS